MAEPQWKYEVVHHINSSRFNSKFEDVVVIYCYVKNT
jgi:hypothetical protein